MYLKTCSMLLIWQCFGFAADADADHAYDADDEDADDHNNDDDVREAYPVATPPLISSSSALVLGLNVLFVGAEWQSGTCYVMLWKIIQHLNSP